MKSSFPKYSSFTEPTTNEDCYRCAKSFIKEYSAGNCEPDRFYECIDKHNVHCQYDSSKKGCGLKEGRYYAQGAYIIV